ncbi:MAG: type IV pilus secretin PilQ [Nitrospira sp.]|nr:type IV pilus secretin PilQ [Nitrospira sp.]MCC7470359.1 type IV pilus secretin PilQ [Candidatus Nomurabacteria bacterium]
MKQSQVGVHPLLSVTVMAGILGLAGYVPLATSAETTGLAGFSQASDQQIAGAAEVVGSDQAHTGVASSAATLLTKVEVKPEGERLSLVLTGNGVFAHTVKMLGDRRMVLDMPHMQSERHQSQLAVGHALLSRVRFGYHQDKVRLVLDLAQPAEHSVDSIDGRLILTLAPKASADQKAADADMPVTTEPAVASPSMPAAHKASKALFRVMPVQLTSEVVQKEDRKPEGNEVVNGSSRFVGRRISLDFQQADISNVLRLIAEVSGFNIVVGEGVKSKVTMKLANVPWDQALDMLLKMNALGMIRQGNIVWVDTLQNIAKQQDEEARAKDSKAKAEPIVTRVFYIRNLNATEVHTSLRQNLSPRGTMTVSAASNALIISDTESKLEVLRQLLDGVDLEVPQVQIEARIVQADTTYTRSLGVQWGIQNVNQLGGASGTSAFKTGTTGAFGAQVSDFLINLPANPGLPSVPGAGFSIGKTDGAMLDVRLSAGELLGLTKVIAAPKITTLDKRDAKIAQGESIPFQTTSLQGTQTTFVDANLELNVTPQITSRDPKEIGKQILMKVRATRNAVGARSNPAGPSIDRREATTQVLVRDGETMVIGGVFVDTQSNNVAGIPYLSRIPVLGWLFKNKTENVSKQELLIFLTPTIVRTTT